MPVVRKFAAPFICTTWVLCVAFVGRCLPIADRVAPQAMPTVIFESTMVVRMRAAVRATRSSRSTSLIRSGTGTTCARTPKRSPISRSTRLRASCGECTVISTRPVSRANPSSREIEEREVRSSCAMASMVRSCR